MFVVDDEPDIRELVRLNLELEGHEVEVVADGAAALAVLAEGLRPDLVLLDLTMPGPDGLEVLRRLKTDPDPDVAATPVVLLTARGGELDRIRGGIEGALRHLTKPFTMAALAKVVAESLEADEAEARLAAQTSALRQLVRLEKGDTVDVETGQDHRTGTRVRFSRLERRPDQPSWPAPTPASHERAAAGTVLELSRLSPKQQEVLRAVGGHPTVRLASAQLGVSRSNVYASLRRIAAKLDVASVHELVALAREQAD